MQKFKLFNSLLVASLMIFLASIAQAATLTIENMGASDE